MTRMSKTRANAPTAAIEEVQSDPPTNVERNRPVHSVRLRNIRAAIWSNDSDQGTRFNATFSRLYKDGEDNWRSSDSFGREDLLLLSKVADLVHTWICGQVQAQEAPF